MTRFPRGATSGMSAVMAQRKSSFAGLDFFPTPPYGTRALVEFVLPAIGYKKPFKSLIAWEPAAGMRHMSDVLAEDFGLVLTSDVHDYGCGVEVGSFVGAGTDVVLCDHRRPHWIITNPPFKLATEFCRRALAEATDGVAMLLRTQFVESAERYALFTEHPLTCMAVFSSRLSMVEGRWDPAITSATTYSWFVWLRGRPDMRIVLIPPDAKDRWTKSGDIAQFAGRQSRVALHGERPSDAAERLL